MKFLRLGQKVMLALFLCIIPALCGIACGLMGDVSYSELSYGADAIIIGTIESVESRWNADHTNIETTAVVTVEEVLKGTVPDSHITLMARGGTIDGFTQWVEHEPIFIPGIRAGIFMRQSDGIYRVYGLYQGMYTIQGTTSVRGYGDKKSRAPTAAEFRERVETALEHREVTGERTLEIPEEVGEEQRAVPSISSIFPSSGSAGTDTIITITGSNFGTKASLDSCADVGFFWVATETAPNTYTSYEIYASGWYDENWPFGVINSNDIVSWSNTQIKVKVPTGICIHPWPYYCSASSGYVMVYDDFCQVSDYRKFAVPFGYGKTKWDDPVDLYINDNYPGIIATPAIQKAINTWNNAIPNSYFRFRYAGASSSTAIGRDGQSLVSWTPLDVNVLAQAGCWPDPDNPSGPFIECDIQFNSNYKWTTGTAGGDTINVEATALHELGHWLFLTDLYGNLPKILPNYFSGYPYDYTKVMFGASNDYYGNMNLKILHTSDIAGIQWIYGTNPVPAISTLNPLSAAAGGQAFTLTVTGAHLVPGSMVRWKGVDRPTHYFSSTYLTAEIPASDLTSPGTADVTVFNPTPGGGTSNALTFTIENPVPTLTSISPTSITGGGPAFTLTVTGSGFLPVSKVQWSGADRTTAYVSSTQLKATIGSADIAVKGIYPVTVFNPAPGGGTSNAVDFPVTDPPPSILSFSPASAYAGGQAFTLSLSGNGIVSGAKIRWNGVERPTTVNSASQLTASIPASDITTQGTATLTVLNPDGAVSDAVTFTTNIPLPVITTFSPASTKAGGSQFTLRVTGSGFMSGSKVRWKGTDRTTMYLSSTELAATIPATDIASTGTASIVVYNPSPAATSNIVTFTVNPASGSPPLPPPPSSGEVVTTETPTTYTYLGYSRTYLQQAQSMKAADTGVSEVKVALAKKGTPSQSINFHIRATLKGTDLAWGTIPPDLVTSTDYRNPSWVRLVASEPIGVTKGNTYYFVLDTDASDLKNYFLVPINGNNPYRDGYHYKNTIGSVNSLYDMLMKVTFMPSSPGSPAREPGEIPAILLSGESFIPSRE